MRGSLFGDESLRPPPPLRSRLHLHPTEQTISRQTDPLYTSRRIWNCFPLLERVHSSVHYAPLGTELQANRKPERPPAIHLKITRGDEKSKRRWRGARIVE